MIKRSVIAVSSVFLLTFTSTLLFAQPLPSSATTQERIKADRKAQDELARGVLPSDRVRAVTSEEQQYDKDATGWLEPWEAKEMMEDQSSTRIKGGPVPSGAPAPQKNWYEEEQAASEQDPEGGTGSDAGNPGESPDGYTY